MKKLLIKLKYTNKEKVGRINENGVPFKILDFSNKE
jgi:hypothetical protein